MADITKHLERAKKYLEKNKLQDAVAEYEAVLAEVPNSPDVLQSLGDLHTRLGQTDRASKYYGQLFDRFAESRDTTKAVALYTRVLKPVAQPPDRMARYAMLLQKQNKKDEAIEQYAAAAELFLQQRNESEALACWEKIAQLDPDNPVRHMKIGEVGERIGKPDIAAKGFLRAGQLAFSGGDLTRALDLLGRANRLAPKERTVALFYGQALLRQGDAAKAVQLLEPFPIAEADPPFLETFGDALLRTGQVERAREVFEQFHKASAGTLARLFDVVEGYVRAGQDEKAIQLLGSLKERMFAAKQQNEFAAQTDALFSANPKSVPIAGFVVHLYEELNRESKYFDALVQYFDLSFETNNIRNACEALDRLVDIDPYDFRNQERLSKLRGKADDNYIRGVNARMAKAASVTGAPSVVSRGTQEPAPPRGEEGKAKQALEDLIVQIEIFIQYSLHDKALERLKKLAEMFPGAEEQNERLRRLYEHVNWWPPGSSRGAASAAPVPAQPAMSGTVAGVSPGKSGVFSADLVRDLARISEITRAIYRQSTPKGVLSTMVNEVGKYLRVTRCIAVLGSPGQPPQMAAEYCAQGVEASGGSEIVKLISEMNQASPDASGGLQLRATESAILREMGLETAMGMVLTDKETQAQVGMIVLADATDRKWKPNEAYLLQAIGDQVVLSANQAKLRSLVRTVAVADEKTGLLSRSSYADCLLAEAGRSRKQGTPVSLILLQVDRGQEILKQHGEGNLDRFMEQLARTLLFSVRQNDIAVKYTAWSLAFVLPDTVLANAQTLAEKLRKVSGNLKAPWDQGKVTLSGAVCQAVANADYDSEDVVTDLINRAEFGLDDAKKKGGDTVVAL